jgi:low temperature requirement protein LtrA
MYAIVRHDEDWRRTYEGIFLWFVPSGILWIIGGFAEPEARLWFWLAALICEYLGPVFGYWLPGRGRQTGRDWMVRGGHMAERSGLFVIICLGETLLVSGATFAEMDWTGPGLGAFLICVAGTISMWWVYFHVGHRRGSHQIETSENPGALARLAFTYAHIPIVAGVVLSAVAAERAIAHPHDPALWGEAAAVLGGLALFLAGNGWFKAISSGRFPLSHIAGLALCGGLALCANLAAVAGWLDLLVLNGLALLVLLLVGIWEHRSVGHQVH